MEYNGYFKIGYVTKTRGLKGEVQLFFEFENYQDLVLDVIFVEMETKLVPFFVSTVKFQSNSTAYLNLDDVTHIDQAQILIRKNIFLPEDKLPVRADDEFLLTDLKGFIVKDLSKGTLGEITEVRAFPQQHIAVLYFQGKEIMFPLNEDLISDIDMAKRILNVDLPEGLIDVYL